MFCENCGKRIKDGSIYCEYCGKPTGAAGAMKNISTEGGGQKKQSFWDSILSVFHKENSEPSGWSGTGDTYDPPNYIPSQKEVIPPGSRPNEILFTPPKNINGGYASQEDDKTTGYTPAKPLEMVDDDDNTTDVSSWDDTFRIPPEPSGLIVLESRGEISDIYKIPLASAMTIGRSAENSDIVLQGDKSVSRKHCRLFKEDRQCYIEDLNSHNHTFVNGNMIEEPTVLQVGDVLRIGKQELVVQECDMEYEETNKCRVDQKPEINENVNHAVFCPACGKKFTGGESFCDECGTRLPLSPGGDNRRISPASVKYCPQCGKAFYEDEQFCDECGARIR